jgi:hypothetical protein
MILVNVIKVLIHKNLHSLHYEETELQGGKKKSITESCQVCFILLLYQWTACSYQADRGQEVYWRSSKYRTMNKAAKLYISL